MSHFLETFLIAKSFYQLNKYNKAWLNTEFSQNTAFIYRKVPTDCLEYSEYSLQFTGIFFLHLHLYSPLAKTWLSTYIRNRISPELKVFHITLYLCSACSFVFFLNRSTTNERASISRAKLEIDTYSQMRLPRDLN